MDDLKQAGILVNNVSSNILPNESIFNQNMYLVYSLVRTSLLLFVSSSMNKPDRERLHACHCVLHETTTDDTGSTQIKIEMRCHRTAGTIAMFMKGYMDKVVNRF